MASSVSDDDKAFTAFMVLWVCIMAVATVAGGAITNSCTNDWWQRECVRRGVAEYSPETAQWRWKVQPKAEIAE